MKIYIAGAITKNPDYRKQFHNAEVDLTHKGHAVINPCKHDGFTYREYINMGLCELMHCDAIYMLKGWENSVGAKLEHEYAKAVGLDIMYQDIKVVSVAELSKLSRGCCKAKDEIKWEQAVANVRTVKEIAYMMTAARMGLCIPYLDHLLKRYESGERTRELYEEMLAVH